MLQSVHGARLALAATLVLAISCSDSTQPDTPPSAPHRAMFMRVISGGGQTGVVGTRLPQPLVLEVLDSVGEPAWGRPIASEIAPAWVITDRNGHATLPWQLGTVPGIQTVKVVPTGQGVGEGASLTVSATALAAPFHHITPWAARPNDHWLGSTPLTRDLLFSPRDTFDNVVPWPTDAALVAPTGWTIRADTVVPPSAAYEGQATIGITAGGKTASRSITRLDDLRLRRWTVSYSCAAPPGVPAVEFPGSSPVDSVNFSGTSTVVAYRSDPDPQGGRLLAFPDYRFYFLGTLISHRPGGVVDTAHVALFRRDIPMQRPDTLDFPYTATSGSVIGTAVPVQPGVNPRYVGGSWCDSALYAVRSPVTLTAN